MVDQRTLDKYKREAKELGRETWYLSWALDLNPEERAKGKTVEVGYVNEHNRTSWHTMAANAYCSKTRMVRDKQTALFNIGRAWPQELCPEHDRRCISWSTLFLFPH